jgi:hypothetical protein
MKILLFAFCFISVKFCAAQQHKTKNLIIVTMDGDFAAREYLKAYKPKVLYIAFDETDDFAHAGKRR